MRAVVALALLMTACAPQPRLTRAPRARFDQPGEADAYFIDLGVPSVVE
jgi:hypothetical protein